MNCGAEGTIVRYGGNKDVDVQFENGEIATGRSYIDFCNGEIRPSSYGKNFVIKDFRVGETRLMNCGMKATIVNYRSSLDMDVKFEDDSVRTNVKYRDFCIGSLRPSRIGETRLMDCGMTATIIAYNDSHNVDVQFENGAVVLHKTYDSFKHGKIRLPKIGRTSLMKCGMKATIIKYRSNDDLDVKFENGNIVQHQTYYAFYMGTIKEQKVGYHNLTNCGMIATIIAYRNDNDIDVRFEDNCIVQHITYDNFRSGQIEHPVTKEFIEKQKELKVKKLMKAINESSKTHEEVLQFLQSNEGR